MSDQESKPNRRSILAGLGVLAAVAVAPSKAFACGARARGWVNTRCGGQIYYPDAPDQKIAELSSIGDRDSILFDFGDQGTFAIDFSRTVNVNPEGNKANFIEYLPSTINFMPIFGQTDKNGAANFQDGEVAVPMHDGEAFFMNFRPKTDTFKGLTGHFAFIPIVNGINVVTGKPEDPNNPQMKFGKDKNYIVVEGYDPTKHLSTEVVLKHAKGMPFLDVSRSPDGRTGQLTARASEGQTTSLDIGRNPSISLSAVPMTREAFEQNRPAPEVQTRSAARSLGGNVESAIEKSDKLEIQAGAGVEQPLDMKDPYIPDGVDPQAVWDTKEIRTVNVVTPEAKAFYKLAEIPVTSPGQQPLNRNHFLNHGWWTSLGGDKVKRNDPAWLNFVKRRFGSEPSLQKNR